MPAFSSAFQRGQTIQHTAVLLLLILFLLTTVDWVVARYPLAIDAWLQQQKISASDSAANDNFGYEVALDGNTAVVGAPQDDDQGTSYIFFYDGSSWKQQAKLSPDDAAIGDYFGWAVALDGDTAVIGAPRYYTDITGSGAAYVFVRNGNSWSQQAKLTANDAVAGDNFGWAVALDGDTAVIGTPQYDNTGSKNGAAYVFVRNGSIWSQQAKLTASDAAAGDQFGWTVAVEGDTAVIGAPQDDDNGNGSGAVYVFARNGTYWNQQTKLTANDAAADDTFGFSVTLENDTIVAGAWLDDTGIGFLSGSAYVFVGGGASWSQQAKLIASDAAVGGAFGWAVALENNTAVIGAVYPSESAYVFIRDGTTWNEQAKLTPSDPTEDNDFGNDVALFGNTIMVGAPADNDGGNASGSAYTFTFSPSVSLSIDDVSLAEGDTATTDFVFTVTRTDNSEAISVDFATADNTATIADSDYISCTGTLNFAAGGTFTQQITIQVNGDVKAESDETFFVNLSNASGGVIIANSPGIGTILSEENDPYGFFLPMVISQTAN